MFAQQYTGQKVFITGHTGFKGAWLCAWLLNLGAEVCGYSCNIPSSPSGFEALGLKTRIKHIIGDVRDRQNLQQAMESFQPDIVFHMAAQALVRPSYDEPVTTFETNAMGTLNLLESVRHVQGIKAVICITSDKCYRNDEWEWGYREIDHLGGDDPYSASKACAEIIAHAYFTSFFTSGTVGATVRAGNVIGGGDWAVDRIIPDCARAYADNEPVVIRNPWATRPWQHVLEPLSGYLWLGALLVEGKKQGLNHEAFNFGPSAEVKATVKTVTEALAPHWPGFVALPPPGMEKAAKESTLLKLCCDKSLARLEWKATLNFTETVDLTASWYHEYYNHNNDMMAYTLEQIAVYAQLAVERGLAWAQ